MLYLILSIIKHICTFFFEYLSLADCEWSDFSVWHSCSQTCGGGESTRTRFVARGAINGGKECTGDALESVSCNVEPCPGKATQTYK